MEGGPARKLLLCCGELLTGPTGVVAEDKNSHLRNTGEGECAGLGGGSRDTARVTAECVGAAGRPGRPAPSGAGAGGERGVQVGPERRAWAAGAAAPAAGRPESERTPGGSPGLSEESVQGGGEEKGRHTGCGQGCRGHSSAGWAGHSPFSDPRKVGCTRGLEESLPAPRGMGTYWREPGPCPRQVTERRRDNLFETGPSA